MLSWAALMVTPFAVAPEIEPPLTLMAPPLTVSIEMPVPALVVEALAKVMPLVPTVTWDRLSAVPLVVLMVLPEPVTVTVPPLLALKPVPLVVVDVQSATW